MKKNKKLIGFTIALFFMIIAENSFGQSLWFQDGSTWVHRVIQADAGGYVETTIEKDTTLGGIACKKLVGSFKLFDVNPPFPLVSSGQLDPPIFMYASADDNEVFYYENGAFKKIYDFNAGVGDTIVLPYNPTVGISSLCPNNDFVIDSVGVENIDGINLKWMSVSPTPLTLNFYNGKIYQKMGSTNWYFNSLVDPVSCIGTVEDMNFVDEFRCFSDANFEFKHQGVIDNFGGNCYFPDTTVTTVFELVVKNNIEIYPNPVNDEINIEIVGLDFEEVTIIDLMGKEVLRLKLETGSHSIDCHTLIPGTYFLKPKNTYKTLKFVKI